MKKSILKWLGLDKLQSALDALIFEINKNVRVENQHYANLSESLDNRRQEINLLIEQLQNLDNHEVISDLHKRILVLENGINRQ